MLRGFARLNVYPSDDVGVRNNLKHWLGLRLPLDHGAFAASPIGGKLLDRLAAAEDPAAVSAAKYSEE